LRKGQEGSVEIIFLLLHDAFFMAKNAKEHLAVKRACFSIHDWYFSLYDELRDAG
jgi:hypothetical protein